MISPLLLLLLLLSLSLLLSLLLSLYNQDIIWWLKVGRGSSKIKSTRMEMEMEMGDETDGTD